MFKMLLQNKMTEEKLYLGENKFNLAKKPAETITFNIFIVLDH